MKATKLTIKNIGAITEMVIPLDRPLILFYGKIRQGKTTILNSIRWLSGAADAPADIIRHGAKEGSIELECVDGSASMSWYRSPKDGTTKARARVLVKNGKIVANPTFELKRMLNPFLENQDCFRNMTDVARKQFLADLLHVDTTALDTELASSMAEAKTLRRTIDAYGEIDLTPTETVDVSALKNELADVRAHYERQKTVLEGELVTIGNKHNDDCAAVDRENDEARRQNGQRDRLIDRQETLKNEIASLETRLETLRTELKAIVIPSAMVLKLKPAIPDRSAIQKKILDLIPDTKALENAIQNGAAQNVRAEQFVKNKAQTAKKEADEAKLSALEKRQREIKKEKIAKLEDISDTCGIPALKFDEAGDFTYEGTSGGMLSESQIMHLCIELASLYKDGFGLELMDRAESLGESIFSFVDRAKEKDLTILATIVAEKAADAPENVGVYVVKEGKLL